MRDIGSVLRCSLVIHQLGRITLGDELRTREEHLRGAGDIFCNLMAGAQEFRAGMIPPDFGPSVCGYRDRQEGGAEKRRC